MKWRDVETFELMEILSEGEEYLVKLWGKEIKMKAYFVVYDGGEECAFKSRYGDFELPVKEVYC